MLKRRAAILALLVVATGSVTHPDHAFSAPTPPPSYADADQTMGWSYLSVMAAYGQKGRIMLRSAQRSWIAQRNKACGFEARNSCATEWTLRRAKELEAKMDRIESDPLRVRVGECFSTTIKGRGGRFGRAEGIEDYLGDDGTALVFADGHYMVDYTPDKKVAKWRNGDPVRLCVTDLPQDCPKGDYRGIEYVASNLRHHTSWRAWDSQHGCGGA